MIVIGEAEIDDLDGAIACENSEIWMG